MASRDRYQAALRARHRPAHARRTVASHATFLVPWLHPGQRLLDLGCGPGSITAGFREIVGPEGTVVGVDLDPGPADVPLARADIGRLGFPDGCFDAVFACAVLQHTADPLAVLQEAFRVCRPGAVIGVADADWGGALIEPADPWIEQGQQLLERLRWGTSIHVGRQLRGLFHRAGFVDAVSSVRAHGGGGPWTAAFGAEQAAVFSDPTLWEVAEEEGLASPAELTEIADAWRRWGRDPAATATRYWFEAVARTPAN